MRLVLTIFFTLLLIPAFARGKKGRGHGHHRHSNHRVAHHTHHRRGHNSVAHSKHKLRDVEPSDPLSLLFEEQMGKLPLPAEGKLKVGNCISPKYPVFDPCFGIEIFTRFNAPVHAVFEGVVSNIVDVEGSQVVLIKHGNYFTVYNNLSSIAVSKGDHVNTMQRIGAVGEDDDCRPVLKFQIWRSNGKKGSEKMDPEKWVACQR